jgi:hypothetical protein
VLFERESGGGFETDRCFEGETCLDPGRERELPAPLEVVGDGGTMMPDDVIIIVLKDPRRSL